MLYCMDVSLLNYEKLIKYVSEDRKEKTSAFHFLKDRKLSLASELLLIYGLNQLKIYDPIIKQGKYGKPYLSNYQNVFFNLSHSGDYVICGIDKNPVGVDIEKIEKIDLNIASKFFYDKEYEDIINSENPIDSFFNYWVLKESYMKYTGCGFRLKLNSFQVDISKDNNKIKLYINNKEKTDLNLELKEIKNNYKIGICSKSNNLKLKDISSQYILDYFRI